MSEDFDKSEQKKTEYVLLDITDVDINNIRRGLGRKVMQRGIQDEINKRPNMRLVNIIPFIPLAHSVGGHGWLHLVFEERDYRLDSIREDIAQIRENSEKMLKNWEQLFREGI